MTHNNVWEESGTHQEERRVLFFYTFSRQIESNLEAFGRYELDFRGCGFVPLLLLSPSRGCLCRVTVHREIRVLECSDLCN